MGMDSAASRNKSTLRRKRKKLCEMNLSFENDYEFTGEILGTGSYGRVETCRLRKSCNKEFAVKIIQKIPGYYNRNKVLKEIETFHICKNHENIIQLLSYYEENSRFYLIFEKIEGGPLLDHLLRRNHFDETEASYIVEDLARALSFLHKKGIAHRDLKPENILCIRKDSPCPVKLGDFDLCSNASSSVSTPRLRTPVGSLEYMAPEVLETFIANDDFDDYSYDKKCDLWSLGVIVYILLCGIPPFSGNCGQECGWDIGESCQACQTNLSNAIKAGIVDFDSPTWSSISLDAIDLLKKLLVKDASLRINAHELLNHPWITNKGSSNPLKTPSMLRRQTSIKDLSEFATSAISLRRTFSSDSEMTTPSNPISIGRSSSFDFNRSSLLQRRINRQVSGFTSIDENN